MSNMKCPFCQQELDTGNYFVHCHNPECDITVEMEGTEEMWEALIRTRKALDVAKDGLQRIADAPIGYCMFAEETLEKITALEQKESKTVHNKIDFPEYNDGLLEEFDKQFFENGQDDDLTETALEQKEG